MSLHNFLSSTKKAMFLSLAFIAKVNTYLKAQPGDHVQARLIRYEIKPAYNTAFKAAVSDYVFYARSNNNNLMVEAYYEKNDTAIVWLIERWSSKTALNKASNSDQFKAIETLAKSVLLQPTSISYAKDLEPLSKQQWRNFASKDDKPITIMLFVDSKPGTEYAFKKIYHEAMPAFRSEPGVINYQLSQFETDSTKFVTYEKFRNEAAFQYHLNFPPIKPVIGYLNTSIKKQPFQDGLHTLIEFAGLEK